MPSRYENTTVNLALAVLRSIVPLSQVSGSTRELRLALRVIRPHVRDIAAAVEFWQVATNPHRKVWETCIGPYTAILVRLKRAGFAIDAENDLYAATL